MNTVKTPKLVKENKSYILVTKLHQKPISITIGPGELQVSMEMVDFLNAAVTEMGNPTFTVTKAQLENNLLVAFNKVIEQMKKETAREG